MFIISIAENFPTPTAAIITEWRSVKTWDQEVGVELQTIQ